MKILENLALWLCLGWVACALFTVQGVRYLLDRWGVITE